jgi:peroxiredoxin
MAFSAPPAGLINRSRRYALYAQDGVVKVLHAEENPGVCETSGGEALLAAMPS